MEPLECKLERLTPEQRREVEDFVDFLLLKNNFRQAAPAAPAVPPVLANAPPVLSPEPAPAQPPQVRMQDLVIHEEPRPAAVPPDPEPSATHEIAESHDDWLTRDYMDLGKFDQQPSPATEAVKNVKRKIIAREAGEKPKQLLDWVD